MVCLHKEIEARLDPTFNELTAPERLELDRHANFRYIFCNALYLYITFVVESSSFREASQSR